MLGHGLSCTETAGNGSCTALCNGENGINDTLTCDKGAVDRQSLCKGSGLLDGPLLAEGKLMLIALSVLHTKDNIIQMIFSVGSSICYLARNIGSHHAAVLNNGSFGAGGIYSAACYHIAHGGLDSYLPNPFAVKAVNV